MGRVSEGRPPEIDLPVREYSLKKEPFTMLNDRQIIISVGSSRTSIDWQAQTMTIEELYKRLQTA